jgi:hypothetical protein
MWSTVDTQLCLIFIIPGLFYYALDISLRLVAMTAVTVVWATIGYFCFASGHAFPFGAMLVISLYMGSVFAWQEYFGPSLGLLYRHWRIPNKLSAEDKKHEADWHHHCVTWMEITLQEIRRGTLPTDTINGYLVAMHRNNDRYFLKTGLKLKVHPLLALDPALLAEWEIEPVRSKEELRSRRTKPLTDRQSQQADDLYDSFNMWFERLLWSPEEGLNNWVYRAKSTIQNTAKEYGDLTGHRLVIPVPCRFPGQKMPVNRKHLSVVR